MGASQGARALNEVLLDALSNLAGKPWQILHLTGSAHYPQIMERTRQMPPFEALRYKAFPFVEEMAAVYAASDLIVSRAGATSLAEIMRAGVPSILVPYPYAADNHQELNARWLENRNGCRVILEKDFSPAVLVSALEMLLGKPESLLGLGENARKASPKDAVKEVVRMIEDVAR